LNIGTKPVPIHNKTTKLAMLLALVGAMVIVVPMLIDQAYAKTFAIAIVTGPGKFGDFIAKMSEGKFIQDPTFTDDKKQMIWQTQGDPEGGNEVGRVKVTFDDTFVEFSWSNPTFEKNTCAVLYFPGTFAECKINEDGERATVNYFVSRTSLAGSCQTGTEKNDNLIGTSENDCLAGGRGNDRIAGLAGNDKLKGGER
jgi:Ca2+-binding RTX toxin-like protein